MLYLLAQTATGEAINFSGFGAAGVTVAILLKLLYDERKRADDATKQSIGLLERVLPLLTNTTDIIESARSDREESVALRQEETLARLEASIKRLEGNE